MESAPESFPNSLKFEHLNKNIKPIMACIGNRSDFGDSIKGKFEEQHQKIHNVNYESELDILKRKKFLNGGRQTYVMSTIDDLDKFSEGFYDCTGLVVVGVDKNTGKNISFLTHQDPKQFLNQKKDVFISHLQQQLIEIKKRCKLGTIDAVIVGGKYTADKYKKNYIDTVKLISSKIQKNLGFEPVVINGPKLTYDSDSVFYENKTKRIYFLRPKVNSNLETFSHSNLKEVKKKLDNEPIY